jgi:hypothetical protein
MTAGVSYLGERDTGDEAFCLIRKGKPGTEVDGVYGQPGFLRAFAGRSLAAGDVRARRGNSRMVPVNPNRTKSFWVRLQEPCDNA